MISRRRLFLVAGTAGAALVFLCFTLLLVPDRKLQDLVVRVAEQHGYTFSAEGFTKAFPLGVKGSGLVIANDRGPLLKVSAAAVRLRILPLLTGKVTFGYQAVIGSGSIQGEYSPRNGEIRIETSGLRLEDFPFFQSVAEARVKGELRLTGSFRGKGREPGGELRLEVKGANISGVKISEMPLPDADYSLIQGMIRRKGELLVLDSFTLQGNGLYVRLKGDFPATVPPDAAPLNLTLELMPKPEFLDRQKFVFLLLAKYLISPGNYQIPIRGTLAKPLIQ